MNQPQETPQVVEAPVMDLEDAMKVMQTSFFDDVRAFHRKFGIGYDGPPRYPLDDDLTKFRRERLIAEMREHLDAVAATDKFDGLIDLVYIALGTCDLHGWNFNEGWRRVHAANMMKVRATKEQQSTFGYKGDIVKPDGWVAPDLSDLVAPKVEDSEVECMGGKGQ